MCSKKSLKRTTWAGCEENRAEKKKEKVGPAAKMSARLLRLRRPTDASIVGLVKGIEVAQQPDFYARLASKRFAVLDNFQRHLAVVEHVMGSNHLCAGEGKDNAGDRVGQRGAESRTKSFRVSSFSDVEVSTSAS